MSETKKEIDEILLESGIINIQQIKKVWDIKRETKQEIADILLELEFATKADVFSAIAMKMDVGFFDFTDFEPDLDICTMISRDMASRHVILPVQKDENTLVLAMKDPTDIYALDDMRLSTGLEIKPMLAIAEDINRTIEKMFTQKEAIEREKEKQKHQEEARKNIEKNKLGGLLISSGVITQEQLDMALSIQKEEKGLLGEILVNKGFLEKSKLYECLEIQLGIPHIDLQEMVVPEDVLNLVNEKICRRYTLVPFERDGICLKVAMSDPLNIFSIDDVRLVTGMEIQPYLGDASIINSILDATYSKVVAKNKEKEDTEKIKGFDEEIEKVKEEIDVEIKEQTPEEEIINISDVQNAPIVKMVNIIFQKAIASRASDIHIEPMEEQLLVRYRIDGQLVEAMKNDIKIHSSLIARIKIISGLNIAEKRIPQDGRISLKIDGIAYDLRVSILPTVYGEKAVLRIQDREGFNVNKKQLGFFEDDLEKFDSILSHPHGIVLVTGPTGSGKSTTLYTALNELCKPNVNIVTVEDPVESNVKGVNQVQVNAKAGLTFASALRSFLRQDPDIIMVGEIRDGETAEIATRAAITGHLVLSTLHTNDAPSTITRLIDMGIEPFLISSTIVGVIAQRLVRRLCPKCKEEHEPELNEREWLGLSEDEDIKIYKQKGCPACNNTGYKGRIAVYEIMTLDREIKDLIVKNANASVLKDAALSSGMKTLRQNCGKLVLNGTTTVDEMLRVTFSIE